MWNASNIHDYLKKKKLFAFDESSIPVIVSTSFLFVTEPFCFRITCRAPQKQKQILAQGNSCISSITRVLLISNFDWLVALFANVVISVKFSMILCKFLKKSLTLANLTLKFWCLSHDKEKRSATFLLIIAGSSTRGTSHSKAFFSLSPPPP